MERAQNTPPQIKTKRRRNRPAAAPQFAFTVDQIRQILLGFMALAGLALMIGPMVGSLPENLGLFWIGSGLLLFALFATAFQMRRQLLRYRGWWRSQGCPACGAHELRRTRRNRLDRWIDRLGIPRRRYICSECGWQGARIDETHLF